MSDALNWRWLIYGSRLEAQRLKETERFGERLLVFSGSD